MKKIISQIFLIILLIMVGFASVFITEADAASLAGINCVTSVNEGETFTVSLICPSGYDVTSAQANVTVTYSDNSKQSDVIIFMDRDDMKSDQKATFTAKVAGKAQISVTNILMLKSNGETVEKDGSRTITLNVVGKTPENNNAGNNNQASNNTGSNSSSGNSSTSGNNGNTTTTPTTPSTSTSTTPKFKDVNETVYTTTRCNLRESYSSNSNKVATVDEGTKLTRKGIGDNGWSKCDYNGKIVYVSTQYLTTTAPEKEKEDEKEEVKFKDTKETLYTNKSCNLRASWSTESEKVGYLNKGQEVERTGYSENGWSRIKYNGKEVYVASRLLTTEKPEEDDDVEENIIDSTEINEEVEKLTEEEMLNIIKEEVGVLPEVGTNVANIAYMIVTMIVIVGLTCGYIYIKKNK